MSNDEKINALESFSRGHYSSEQFYANGICDYFFLLRNPKTNLDFLNDLESISDLFDYAKNVIRIIHQERIYD